ncbi:hypothetical protein Acr_00g0002640 [Actinidia rufa]|uniref:Uncharacterized protein n=1 Tax=Actinidia rufa TaxID=165716 RepID=A0A7J0D6Y9_9ERIC|nr:hypothetical protein Acr_00g0002640 [Actinidia rufa]
MELPLPPALAPCGCHLGEKRLKACKVVESATVTNAVEAALMLTDGLSCLDKRALRQSWAEKDGVWPRISLSPMHVQSCNAVEADDVSWGHMSVVDTDLVILIPIGHSRVFCAFRLVSDDSADSISLFYVNNQYPMTGWGKESKWCIYSPKWSLSPRLFPGHCSETSITLSAPTEPRKDRKAKVKAQIHALVPPLCERAPIAVTHVERVKARRNSKARMQAKARSQGQARVSPTEGNSITNEERYIPTAPKWLADECVESDSSLKCGWTTFPGEKSGRDKDTIPTAAGGGETFEPDTSTARSFGAVVPGLDCKGSRNALKLNEDPMLRLAASADALCLGTYFSYVVSTDGTWSPCASDRDRARNSPANEILSSDSFCVYVNGVLLTSTAARWNIRFRLGIASSAICLIAGESVGTRAQYKSGISTPLKTLRWLMGMSVRNVRPNSAAADEEREAVPGIDLSTDFLSIRRTAIRGSRVTPHSRAHM